MEAASFIRFTDVQFVLMSYTFKFSGKSFPCYFDLRNQVYCIKIITMCHLCSLNVAYIF